VAWAQEKINEKYSYQDFQDKSFKDVDASEFNDTTIAGSNFFQFEKPYADIFPDGMKNVIFLHCNLDNVDLSKCEGCKIEGTTTNKQLKVQNDTEYWIVQKASNVENAELIPVEPLRKEKFLEVGISILPQDIPTTKKDVSPVQEAQDAAISASVNP
jgi:hypothetical protein